MKLSSESDKRLRSWVRLANWNVHHPLDWQRFYEFVDQYQRDHGFLFDPDDLTANIKSHLGIDTRLPDELNEAISRKLSVGRHILDFLEQTNR